MEKGTKELGEILKFICALANTLGEASKDDELSASDAAKLIPLMYKIPGAIEGISEIPSEVADISEDEIEKLVSMIKDELDLPQDKIEHAIEDSIEICVKLYALVQKFKA